MELFTVGTGLAVIGSKDLLLKILGPTAEYLGDEFKGLVQKCNVNLNDIFARAQRKLGERLDEPGSVSPRILRDVINEGRFCEDAVVADYYGGVLAASKSNVSRDDRGVAILATVKALSVYQLRLHYFFYSLVHAAFRERGKNLGTDRSSMGIYVPGSAYARAMAFSPLEDAGSILSHSVEGLVRLGLVEDDYCYGSKEHVAKRFPRAAESGLIMAPNLRGAEVFLWGQGIKGATGHELVEPQLTLPPPEMAIPGGCEPIEKPN